MRGEIFIVNSRRVKTILHTMQIDQFVSTSAANIMNAASSGQSDADENRTFRQETTSRGQPILYTSTELLRGQKEAWIEHGDELYRLRLTSRGNLILTK